MSTSKKQRDMQWLLAAILLAATGTGHSAATTNTAPYSESFEAAMYTDGFQVPGTNGWTALLNSCGTINLDPAVISAEAAYATGGRSLPLSGPHAKVLRLTDEVDNNVRSTVTGGVVAVEFMAYPTRAAWAPEGDPNWQYAFYVNASSNLVVWHQNRTGGLTNNEWRALASSPALDSAAWARFTVVQDYRHGLFQIQVNEGAALTDPVGWAWTNSSLAQTGSWFYMVQTNQTLSLMGFGESVTNYVDDVLVTNRGVSWSAVGFTEGLTNNGTINSSLTLGLRYDTFAGTNGENLVGNGKVTVTNLPSGLTAVATITSPTQLVVTLTGAANSHENANDSSNVGLLLQNSAFTLGTATNVDGASRTNLVMDFQNTPQVGYSRFHFDETTANDGTIENSSPMLITLTNATFAGSVNDDFVASNRLSVVNLPANLTAVATLSSPTQLTVSLTGSAQSQEMADSVSNLTFVLLDSAFSSAPAYSVAGATRTNLLILFQDVLQGAELQWGGSVFQENPVNDGSVPGTTLTLMAKDFAGSNTEDFAASGKVTYDHVPPGLTLHVVRDGVRNATLSFSGQATDHTSVSNVNNLTIAFLDTAFIGGGAAAVANASRSDLQVQFLDQPVLAFSPTVFNETSLNTGAIDNSTSNRVTLSGGTFAGSTGDLFGPTQVSVANLPPGLSAMVRRTSGTTLSVELTGQATDHASVSNVNTLAFTFLDGAFNTVPAAHITGSTVTGLAIHYLDPPVLAFSPAVFDESVTNNGAINNATSNRVTLSGGTFTGSTGDLFGPSQVTVANLPPGLTTVVRRTSGTTLSVELTGQATDHTSASNVNTLAFTFLDGAFNTVPAANITGSSVTGLGVHFLDQPALNYDTLAFTEAAANNGGISNTIAITLSVDTFVTGPFVSNTHYTVSGIPAGLTFTLTRQGGTAATAALTGTASLHGTANDVASGLVLTFLNAAFTTVPVANITSNTAAFSITFANPPGLTYSGDTFTEASAGTVNNSHPIIVTLTGDTFQGEDSQDFVAAGRITASHVPAGLSVVATRAGATHLSITLTGIAEHHDAGDSRSNLTLQFHDSAFTYVAADGVSGTLKSDLRIDFISDTPHINDVPYLESFEGPANGMWLALWTNGWTSTDQADAGIVTAETSVLTPPHNYVNYPRTPIATNHTQTLAVQAGISGEIRSTHGTTVYTDFLAWPAAMQDLPQVTTSMQFAFYVATNGQLVVWHQNRTGTPANELRTLANGPVLDTNQWTRFTITQDYTNFLFQIQVNKSEPIQDPAGWSWSAGSLVQTGSWFHMVYTNDNRMNRFGTLGAGLSYVDDLAVTYIDPNIPPSGSIYLIR